MLDVRPSLSNLQFTQDFQKYLGLLLLQVSDAITTTNFGRCNEIWTVMFKFLSVMESVCCLLLNLASLANGRGDNLCADGMGDNVCANCMGDSVCANGTGDNVCANDRGD